MVKNAARLAVYVATNIVPVIHHTAATTLPKERQMMKIKTVKPILCFLCCLLPVVEKSGKRLSSF